LQQSLAARLDRLGPAREVAQIGAVLGREFAYPLLRDVAEAEETALQASLDRLAEADLLFVEGAPPQAKYRFKHALIQDAAYDSLLRSRRQALHRRAAEALSDQSEPAAAAPEVIAHHYTHAGLDDLAIEWWGRAGEQALRRSAFHEATAHLGKAIEMADKAAAVASRRGDEQTATSSQRMKLQSDYGRAVRWSKGFAAEETKAAFDRAAELAAISKDFSDRFAAHSGQWTLAQVRGELRKARELASAFLREAESAGRLMEAGVAHRGLAFISHHAGDFLGARFHCEQALATCSPERDQEARELSGEDTGAVAMAMLAMTSWQLGDVDPARELIEAANRRAAEIGHVPSMAMPLHLKCLLEIFRGDASAALIASEALDALSREHGMALQQTWAVLNLSWAHGRLHDPKGGAAAFKQALEALAELGHADNTAFFLGMLAQLEAEAVGVEAALARVDEALALICQGEVRFCLAFLHRLRGDLLLKRDPPEPSLAEDAFRAAIAIAKQQSARSYHLQAALPLAKLYQSTGRPADAHAVLGPVLEGFSPTPEMPEIAEAQALFATLAETEAVMTEATKRRRLSQLNVAYGNALFAARGYGAPETSAAFSRARDSAEGERHARARLAADYGVWVGSYVRGELSSMRAHAETFLSDVRAKPDSPEAGIAYRVCGVTHQFAGEYREARASFERALALFQAGRDDDLAFDFGLDVGITVLLCSAIASWPLGEVARAASLFENAQTRMDAVTHAGVLAFGRQHSALFDLMRRNAANVATSVSELARLAREHDLTMFRAFAVFFEGWATVSRGELGGLEDMRRGVGLLREQNVLQFDGLIKIALAEAEAQAGDVERAIATIDEALATAELTGYRAFEAELHRVRGEMMLRRGPAKFAEAEQALQTAVAIARQQGTHAFELRAALSLAKLLQSTNRPAESHAILAPALEGFSPTPEMPEIEEARALLERLALGGEEVSLTKGNAAEG
jgi:predicted ATPase